MSRFPTIDPVTATGPAKDLLAAVHQSLGVTPDMTVMAGSPTLLEGYVALVSATSGGVLDAGVRERIALAVAEYNGCEYCLSAHADIGANVAKVPDAELHRDVGDVVLAEVRAAGVTDSEILGTVGHVVLNVRTNYANKITRVDTECPVVTPGQRSAA